MLVAGKGLGEDVTNAAATRPHSSPPGSEDQGRREEGVGEMNLTAGCLRH